MPKERHHHLERMGKDRGIFRLTAPSGGTAVGAGTSALQRQGPVQEAQQEHTSEERRDLPETTNIHSCYVKHPVLRIKSKSTADTTCQEGKRNLSHRKVGYAGVELSSNNKQPLGVRKHWGVTG